MLLCNVSILIDNLLATFDLNLFEQVAKFHASF